MPDYGILHIQLKMEALTAYSYLIYMEYPDGTFEALGILALPEGE